MRHHATFVYVIVCATGKRLYLAHSGALRHQGIKYALNRIKAEIRRVSGACGGLGTTGRGPALRGAEGPKFFWMR